MSKFLNKKVIRKFDEYDIARPSCKTKKQKGVVIFLLLLLYERDCIGSCMNFCNFYL